MTPAEVVRALAHYHVNVLTGDCSQVVQVVHHISTLSAEERSQIRLTKVLYTSEPLTVSQRSHITAVLGPVRICSVWGSAEAGPCAISNPDLTGDDCPPGTTDFVIDTRNVIIEILPTSASEGDSPSAAKPVPDGEEGIIVQTSLQRRRNPLVRYITGDVGSLQPLPEAARAIVPEAELKHLRVLRLRGRDRRFSFKWYGAYFDFENIVGLMQTEKSGILQWQVVLGSLESSPQTKLEIRLLREVDSDHIMPKDDLVKLLETFFFVMPESEHLFQITFLNSLAGFEKSSTGNKVMKFVDRVH
jgi:phenylacetate-coenzyme A ligase PaaK-like adenylate-forming protein